MPVRNQVPEVFRPASYQDAQDSAELDSVSQLVHPIDQVLRKHFLDFSHFIAVENSQNFISQQFFCLDLNCLFTAPSKLKLLRIRRQYCIAFLEPRPSFHWSFILNT